MLPHISLSLRKFKYIRGSPGGMFQCVADIVPATGNFNCAHQAGTRGSYAYVYVAENETCHICRHSREIGNRSLEHLPISQYPVYQRGISYCSYSTRRNNFVIGVWAISKLSRSCLEPKSYDQYCHTTGVLFSLLLTKNRHRQIICQLDNCHTGISIISPYYYFQTADLA